MRGQCLMESCRAQVASKRPLRGVAVVGHRNFSLLPPAMLRDAPRSSRAPGSFFISIPSLKVREGRVGYE